MRLATGLSLGLLVLVLASTGLQAEQKAAQAAQETAMDRGYDRPHYDRESRLFGYPSLGIKPQFSHALPFSEDGLARVIVGCRYASCKEDSPGYNKERKRAWAYIDRSFEKEPGTYDPFDPKAYAIYNERFAFASSFSEDYPGLAKVRIPGETDCYYINTKGEILFGLMNDGRIVLEPSDELIEWLTNEYTPARR
jgi:hypothetical protein